MTDQKCCSGGVDCNYCGRLLIPEEETLGRLLQQRKKLLRIDAAYYLWANSGRGPAVSAEDALIEIKRTLGDEKPYLKIRKKEDS